MIEENKALESLLRRCNIAANRVKNFAYDGWSTEIPLSINLVDAAAMEANEIRNAQNLGINDHGTPMKVGWCNDETIERNHLKPVKSAIMFEKGNVPTKDGLFSYETFGNTTEERKCTCAYIDLGRVFFHPYAYEALCALVSKAPQIAAGRHPWKIVDGKPVEITDENDPEYNEDNTGLRWLINNFRKFKMEKNRSYTHNQYVELFQNSRDDEILISKWLVVPVFYRDANFSGHSRDIPEINDYYKKLIQFSNALKATSMANYANNTEFSIQQMLVTIRQYAQSLIEGKNGFLKQFVLGKTTAYGARNVITEPIFSGADTPEDTMVDIMHSGFPIATCCSMAYPFIEHWITNFFSREFETREKKQILIKDKDGSYHLEFAKIGDVMAFYKPSYIESKVEQFMHTYGNRFEPLVIPMADGTEAYMLFTGKPYAKNPRSASAPATARRAMTWTDLLYLACVETLEYGGKMAYITRYPLEDYFGTFPSMIRVSSTLEHEPMEINGKQYPFYPKVEVGLSQDETSTRFIDTVTMDNTYLKGLGGDYDGDMISEKACFTEEANDEAFAILNDAKHFVSISGNMMRTVGNETFLTYYNMTKR
jgi:hypothetical protein